MLHGYFPAILEGLAEAAPHAGFFNPVVDSDGVVRSGQVTAAP